MSHISASRNHGHSAAPSWVTAPPGAWPTSRAYLASAPARCRGGRCFQACRRFANSSSSISRSRRRAAASMQNPIPLLHQRQRAADERFPARHNRCTSPGGAGKAPVGDKCDLLSHSLPVNQRGDPQHLAHAGTAHGPSLRMTRTSPAAYLRLRTASTHPSSSSNTRAVPSNTRFLRPATLMTAPSGAKVALQNRDATVRTDRRACRGDDLAVGRIGAAVFFRQSSCR